MANTGLRPDEVKKLGERGSSGVYPRLSNHLNAIPSLEIRSRSVVNCPQFSHLKSEHLCGAKATRPTSSQGAAYVPKRAVQSRPFASFVQLHALRVTDVSL
jgi:hypothetical protein